MDPSSAQRLVQELKHLTPDEIKARLRGLDKDSLFQMLHAAATDLTRSFARLGEDLERAEEQQLAQDQASKQVTQDLLSRLMLPR